MIKTTKLNEPFFVNDDVPVKVTRAGNITKIQYMSNKNREQTVRMLDGGNQYLNLKTGEICDIQHHNTRQEQIKSLRRTFNNLRELINANTYKADRVRFITLTYRENMTDVNKLYKDFKNFNARFRRYLKRPVEFICCVEAQARGA